MKLMTPEARRSLQIALQGDPEDGPVALLEVNTERKVLQPAATGTGVTNSTLGAALAAAETADPVSDLPSDNFGWKKCGDVPYNCPRLHDMLSIEWGKFRDQFDILSNKMEDDA